MVKQIVTYGLLDEKLRALGFTVRTVKKSRVYNHEHTGASIYLPALPFSETAQPAHLVAVRFVLDNYSLGELNGVRNSRE